MRSEEHGVSLGLQYHDPADKRRGGTAHLNTPQVRDSRGNFCDINMLFRQILFWILTEE